MPAVAAAVLTLFVLLVPQAARADVVWLCGLSAEAQRLFCVVDAQVEASEEAPPQPRAVVRGTAFPLDVKRLYIVDLWSPATDRAFVEELAAATICYRTAGCSVVLNGFAGADR
jgi:hypothetical protein